MSQIDLGTYKELTIRQQTEIAEFFGFETRNKYGLYTSDGQLVGHAAEQGKGFFGLLMRQFFGHWRKFDIHIFNSDRRVEMIAHHPFRWIFQRLEIKNPTTGKKIGAIQQRFAIFSKRFDVEDENGRVFMEVSSPIWKLWTFEFYPANGSSRVLAIIKKRWSGILWEALTDKDRFSIEIQDQNLNESARKILVAAGLFIDLQYYENKAKLHRSSSLDQ